MCDPVSIAMSLGGFALQQMGQSKAEKARRGVITAEGIRRRGYEDTGRSFVDENIEDFDANVFKTATSERARRIGNNAQKIQDETPSTAAQEPTGLNRAPKVISSDINRERSEQAIDSAGDTKRFGIANAFNDTLMGRNRDLVRTGNVVQQQGNFARGSAGIVPLELQAASKRGAGLRALGDLLKLGSAVYGMPVSAPTTVGTIATPSVLGPLGAGDELGFGKIFAGGPGFNPYTNFGGFMPPLRPNFSSFLVP